MQADSSAIQTLQSSLVYVQTLILMALQAGLQGRSAPRAGPSPAVWIGSAVSAAYQYKLYIPDKDKNMDDSDEKLKRQVWFSLVIIDKFQASGTGSPGLIPEVAIVLLPQDINALHDEAFHLARLAIVVDKAISMMTWQDVEGTPPSISLRGAVKGQIERVCTPSTHCCSTY
jgi:hypothetical protein